MMQLLAPKATQHCFQYKEFKKYTKTNFFLIFVLFLAQDPGLDKDLLNPDPIRIHNPEKSNA
jgi:hypothetical protein